MAFRVEITSRAERDLDLIFSFIRADATQAANEWFIGLAVAIRSLCKFPERGTQLRDAPHYRQLLYGTAPNVYRIIYRLEYPETVYVLHVRHGARKGSGIRST